MDAREVVTTLARHAEPTELPKVRTRLAPDEEAFGLRMRDVFEVARTHTSLPLAEVHRLLDHPAYEPRMAAFCILDFQARGRLDDAERRVRYELYLDRHDRITTWDMVDRSAPRVVGGYLLGRSKQPLLDLAVAPDPLRRRTAVTAPLLLTRRGPDAELTETLPMAAALAADPDPVVHKAAGILLKHAGVRVPAAVCAVLEERGRTMQRAALRLAVEKLEPADRARYLG